MERSVIEFCAPTLASIKVGSLFNYAFASENMLQEQLGKINGQVNEKGVFLRVLRIYRGRALILLYRSSQMTLLMSDPEIVCFLRRYGYPCLELEGVLHHLQRRIQDPHGFPHEIGIFLGYPLEDVIGFICCNGQCSKCTGAWKVYGDVARAQKIFARFAKCHSVYYRLWQQGMSIRQLTVNM